MDEILEMLQRAYKQFERLEDLHMKGYEKNIFAKPGESRYSRTMLSDGTAVPELVDLGFFIELFVGVTGVGPAFLYGLNPVKLAGDLMTRGIAVHGADPSEKRVNRARKYIIKGLGRSKAGTVTKCDVLKNGIQEEDNSHASFWSHFATEYLSDSGCHTLFNESARIVGEGYFFATFKLVPEEGWEAYQEATGFEVEFPIPGNREVVKIKDPDWAQKVQNIKGRAKEGLRITKEEENGERTLRFYTRGTPEKLLASAGFRIAKIKYAGKEHDAIWYARTKHQRPIGGYLVEI